MASSEHLLVTAIDLGTTYSGYAFSSLNDYKRDPLKVSVHSWTAGSGGLMSLKTSTCVLFKPDGAFHSFGFEAEEKYSDLALDGEQEGWRYFRRFKMKLYENKSLNRRFTIEDDQGQSMQAIEVFTAVIKYLKDHMMCNNQMTGKKSLDILWVLTVPAIWSDASKQFMREAAEAAGIRGDHLKIALEPEAASLYCMYLPLKWKGEGRMKPFTSGSKYVVLDAGGGTIDITVHEVQRDGSLKEIHKANGGDWGGTKVDHAFQLLLSGIIGNGAFNRFMENNKADMVEFFRNFEVRKRTIKPDGSSNEKNSFKIPMSMNDACKDENNQDIATIVKSKPHLKGTMSIVGDKLRMKGDRAKELFKDPARHIVDHLKKLLREPSARGVTSILMVGGFSESLVLQDEIKRNFPTLQMTVPQDAGLAVLKGAVIFGHNARYTHDVQKPVVIDGEEVPDVVRRNVRDARVKRPEVSSKQLKRIPDMSSHKEHLLVAAIDFGTTYSGYGFSFRHDFKREPLYVSGNNWTAGSGNLISLKTSTCVLFDPDGKFHSFGYDAEDKYSDLALDGKQDRWRYFRRFKMKLYENKQLNRFITLEDDQGQSMQAIKVFTAAIKYLKDHMMETCDKQMTGMRSTDLLWVLTVPAIWSDASKQFMREAAEAAGISRDQLMIALEPEAASLYCQYLPLERKESGMKAFSSGSKYVVLDAGGGTIDITVHEVQRDGSLKEIHKANGGDWGGTKVDHAFQCLLSGIIGNGAFQRFIENNKADMVEFFRDFEVKKRKIKPNPPSEDKTNFRIPYSMTEACKYTNGQDIKTLVESKEILRQSVSCTIDKLRVKGDVARRLFEEPVKHIVDHLKKLLREPSARGVTSILMVGGFSESLVLQDEIKRNFPSLLMIVPPDAGLAVIKGAVIYGHEPRAIKSRVCKYTYGVDSTDEFDENLHNISKRVVWSDGSVRCGDIFSVHVREGDSVNIGEPQVKRSYTPARPGQTGMKFNVCISKKRDPMYVTDPDCTKIGQFRIDMPDTSKGLDRSIEVQMTFSKTELEIEATNENTGELVTAAFDFL